MNIFILHDDPVEAARMQCDKHIVKMVLESAQMLSTISHGFGGITPYGPTHVNHPCTTWARSSYGNWCWLLKHAQALGEEYTFRYGRVHKSTIIINELASQGARPKSGGMTDFSLCMPEIFKIPDDPIVSYRLYYAFNKSRFARWNRGREAPCWWNHYVERIKNENQSILQ